jgi:hypothetical protein
VWRLLLNYLPPSKAEWASFLEKKRRNYANFVRDLIKVDGDDVDVEREVVKSDHPLSSSPESKWSEFFRDNDVLLQIDKDVR